MKKNFLLTALLTAIVLFPLRGSAQWTKTILPDPPYGHGALPGRVISMATSGPNIYAGTLGGNIYLSPDNGNTWSYIDSGLTTSNITSILTTKNVLYVGAYGNIANSTYGMHGKGSGVYISTNSGGSWTKAGPSLADTNIYTLAAVDSNIFVGTWGGGIYTSSDSGNSWTPVNNGMTNPFVRTIATKGTRIFVGTWGDGVFFSDDYGQSWTPSNLGINNLFVYDIAADSFNVYAGNTEGIYLSRDGGFSWSLNDSGLTTTYVNTFIVLQPDLFVGTSGQGVFISLNRGTSWAVIDTGLTDGYIYCFAENNSRLFAGSANGEIWSMPLSTIMAKVTAIKEKPQHRIAGRFSLFQNYPNPFNPSTVISYQLSAVSHVAMKVYDVLGREVATLVDGKQDAGSHAVSFDGSGLPSGVYFYRIDAMTSDGERFLLKKKMVLVR